MSVLTRIKNNQIVNSTIIASQKIAAGTITGSLFSSNVTVPGDLLISGNLFVLGTSAYTTIASTNTFVNDPLITLNNGFAGTNTYDEGLIFNRGSLQNRALVWSEYFTEFRLIGTTETGTTYGNVAVSNYANLHIGNLTVDYTITHNGNFFTSGFINTTGNVSASQVSVATLNATGLINTLGNVSAAVVNAGALNATGTTTLVAVNSTGFINTTGNVSAAVVNAGALNATGTTTLVAVNSTGLINTTGNVLATGGIFNALTVNGTAGVTTLNATTLTASGNIIAGNAQFAAINSTPIGNGNATASTGTFTVLAATNNLWANASIATTTQGTGAVVIPNGGISVSGAANIAGALTVGGATQLNNTLGVGGISTFTNTTNATTINNGAVIIQGGASVAKDLYVGGNLYAANIIGITANVITVEDPLVFFKPSYTFPYNYDIGFYSAFTGTGLTTAGNVTQHTAVIRNNSDNTWTFASNLAEPGAGFVVLGADTVYDPIKAGNLTLVNTTASTTTGTGALVVAGGAGIGGAVTAGSFNTAGNLSAAGVDAGALNATGTTTLVNVNATGLINTTSNISAAVVNGGAINSTGFINTTANISGAVVNTGALNATGTTTLVAVNSTGFINTTANISAAVVNTGALNATGTTTLVAVNSTGFINTTANVSAAIVNTGALNATGVASITNSTDTSSLSTGALIVTGGTAVGKTLWVGEGAVINSTRAAEAFQVYGATGNNGLIFTNTAKNAIVFSSTGNTTVQDGVITKFDSDGAIKLPTGATASRPGSSGNVDVAGLIRFNTTINNVEFYDGTTWQTAGSSFTVISDRQFSGNTVGGFGNVDGSNTEFTLQSNATTSSSIVSINGVLQFPTLAYSVSGATMTFTEPPAPDDVIDVRILTTTTTVSSITSGNGLNQFTVDSLYANVQTGASTSTSRISVNNDGNISIPNGSPIVYNQSNIAAQGTNTKLLDSFSTSAYGTAKYLVQIRDGANIESAEVLLAQDGVNVSITTYAVIAPAGALGTFQSNISSGIVRWFYTPTISTFANIKIQTTYIV